MKTGQSYRKNRSTNVDTRLWSALKLLAAQKDMKMNVLLDQAIVLLLEKNGMKDPRARKP